MSCCDDAANHLITALGGVEVCTRVVGGTKWWQVRGEKGIDAEWITARKDYDKYKAHEMKRRDSSPHVTGANTEASEETYQPEMDAMRCVLYSHGGGYYFGSVDQERYGIQRYARKINGRVFAVNYRLSPQYPFPCAIQDLLAAYLFLIRPPVGAAHQPVKPEHIVVAGDSAGGGLTLALLQVIRDSGLPLPAGGVLVSPWCDLSHSFPSIHTNTATDVIPAYGLCLHKPSVLWPPPPEELTSRVHSTLRSRIRRVVHRDSSGSLKPAPAEAQRSTSRLRMPTLRGADSVTRNLPKDGEHVDVGATAPWPSAGDQGTAVQLRTEKGEVLRIEEQVQLYCPNNLVQHPLVSPALSYLGGLPPLMFVISDKEVLRDEGIYTAHKAAHPEKHPVKEETRKLYPVLEGIEDRYRPTQVHIQVYDDAAHVLPVLFAFTTPAKFCFRAMAAWIKYVTGVIAPTPQSSLTAPEANGKLDAGLGRRRSVRTFLSRSFSVIDVKAANEARDDPVMPKSADPRTGGRSVRRSISASVTRAASLVRRPSTAPSLSPDADALPVFGNPPSLMRQPSSAAPSGPTITEEPESMPVTPHRSQVTTPTPAPPVNGNVHESGVLATDADDKPREDSTTSSDVGGPRLDFIVPTPPPRTPAVRLAGDPIIYATEPGGSPFKDNMIRERVSTQGEIRPLEPESELGAMKLVPAVIGEVSELAARRYIEGRGRWDKKFAHATKQIEKTRGKNLERARKDTIANLGHLQMYLHQETEGGEADRKEKGKQKEKEKKGITEGLAATSGSWAWAWALETDERPPPSSIAARRDTHEARRLARIADQHLVPEASRMMTGNTLWSLVNDFLTAGPSPVGKDDHHRGRRNSDVTSNDGGKKHRRLLSRLRSEKVEPSTASG